MNRIWLYKDGPEGMLSALAAGWYGQEKPETIVANSRYTPELFSAPYTINSNAETAAEFLRELSRRAGKKIRSRVLYAASCGNPGFEYDLYQYIRLLREKGPQIDGDFSNAAVAHVRKIARQVSGEAHRLNGLVRFRELTDGQLWAPLTPDHYVLPFIAWHFRRRMPATAWVLHDVRRNEAILWDGKELQPAVPGAELQNAAINHAADEALPLSSSERECAEYWRTFFKSIAVPGRANPKLQRGNMPQRYWTWLIEKQLSGRILSEAVKSAPLG